ncbi:MAG TPA: hypothetical protein VGO31_15540 [Microbacteriaceae bacterium]|nr:hypothetical protein [Microbacteriaceae bacterium]
MWAADQIVAVTALHREINSLECLLANLWLTGHWVEVESLRALLIAPFSELTAAYRHSRAQFESPADLVDHLVESMGSSTTGSLAIAGVRLGGNRSDLENVMWAILELATGGLPAWADDEDERDAPRIDRLVAQAFGVDRAQRDVLAPGTRPLLPETFDVREFLIEAVGSGILDFDQLAAPLASATHEDLARAQDAAAFITRFAVVAGAIEVLRGSDIGGLGMLRLFERPSVIDTAVLARSVLLSPPADPAVRTAIDDQYERASAFLKFCRAFPAHVELLRIWIQTNDAQARRELETVLNSPEFKAFKREQPGAVATLQLT